MEQSFTSIHTKIWSENNFALLLIQQFLPNPLLLLMECINYSTSLLDKLWHYWLRLFQFQLARNQQVSACWAKICSSLLKFNVQQNKSTYLYICVMYYFTTSHIQKSCWGLRKRKPSESLNNIQQPFTILVQGEV